MDAGPLAGRTVLDLTSALAGPFATLMLASLGARVIKIENPMRGGDTSRSNSPYMTATGLSMQRNDAADMSVSMLVRGRNKESITLNLKSDAGRRVFLDLVANADIVVENFSAGVTRRLGIDYEAVRDVNPRIVYTSISGFGAQGLPSGDGKAMDTIIQALSGVMMTAGHPDDPPIRFGLPIADLTPPLFATIGTLAALIDRDRTGEGQHVDVSMLGSLTALVASEPFDALESAGIPLRTGPVVPRLAPFGTFEAADGWFAICAPTDQFVAGLLSAMGRPELVTDERFATRDARVRNAEVIHGLISDWAAGLPRDQVLTALEDEGVPVAPVREIADAVRDEIVLSRREVVPVIDPRFGEVEGLYGNGLPIVFSRSSTDLSRPAPGLGEHTDAVLREIAGYTDDDVLRLREGRVV